MSKESTQTSVGASGPLPKQDTRAGLLRTVLDSYLSSKKIDATLLPSLLNLLTTHNLLAPPLSSKSVYKDWKVKLEELLRSRSPSSRWVALILLSRTVEHAPYEALAIYSESWAKDAISTLKRDEPDWVQVEALHLVEKIAQRYIQWPDLRRTFLQNNLGQMANLIVTRLTRPQTSVIVKQNIFQRLHFLLNLLPTAMRPHVKSIEDSALSYINHEDPQLRKEAAACLSMLPKAARKVDDDEEKSDNSYEWSSFFNRVIVTLHKLLDNLYASIKDDKPSPAGVTSKAFKYMVKEEEVRETRTEEEEEGEGKEEVERLTEHLLLFQAFANVAELCLSNTYPSQISVPLLPLLQLLDRILAVNPSSLHESSNELMRVRADLLLCSLPELHEKAFLLLEKVVERLKLKVLPHFRLISLLFQRSLAAYKDQPPALRRRIYESLKKVSQSLGGGPSLKLTTQLFPMILSDLKPLSSTHKGLQLSERKGRPRNKRQRVEAIASVSSSSSSSLPPSALDLSLQLEALAVVETLLLKSGGLWPSDYRLQVEKLSISILDLCAYAISNGPPADVPRAQEDGSILFHNAEYRLAYLKVLSASMTSPVGANVFFPIVADIFRRWASDPFSASVADFCENALSRLELLIHPCSPPLHQTWLPSSSSSLGSHQTQSSLSVAGQLIQVLSQPPNLNQAQVQTQSQSLAPVPTPNSASLPSKTQSAAASVSLPKKAKLSAAPVPSSLLTAPATHHQYTTPTPASGLTSNKMESDDGDESDENLPNFVEEGPDSSDAEASDEE